jgi:hypothetical protein
MNYLDEREIQVTLYFIICIYLNEEKKLLKVFLLDFINIF